MLNQLWSLFQELTGIATDQLAVSLQEIPSSNAMEMGRIMQAVSHEQVEGASSLRAVNQSCLYVSPRIELVATIGHRLTAASLIQRIVNIKAECF